MRKAAILGTAAQISVWAMNIIEESRNAAGESPGQLEYEIRQITMKKEDILDAFFSKDITLTVDRERRVELRLHLLPEKWRFVLDSMTEIRRSQRGYYDTSVPTSVSRPFRSSKGME